MAPHFRTSSVRLFPCARGGMLKSTVLVVLAVVIPVRAWGYESIGNPQFADTVIPVRVWMRGEKSNFSDTIQRGESALSAVIKHGNLAILAPIKAF